MSPRNAAQNKQPESQAEAVDAGAHVPTGGSGSSSASTPDVSPEQELPPSLPPPGAPDVLPLDHTLPDLLKQVSGTDSLPAVRGLKLRVIARETSLQRLSLYVPALRELNLDGSCLGSLRDLGCGLGSLHILRVGGCGLDSLDGTSGFSVLRELHAANNFISDVSSAAFLPRLRLLDVRRNTVSDLVGVSFLDRCRRLESLQLLGNPVTSAASYRTEVARLLPRLERLDDCPLLQDRQSDDNHRNEGDGESDGAGGDGAQNCGRAAHDDNDKPNQPQDEEEAGQPAGGDHQGDTFTVRDSEAKPKMKGGACVASRRPLTASSSVRNAVQRQPIKTRPPSRVRPASAAPRLTSVKRLADEVASGAVNGDSPSTLTSGGLVCGNLAAALLRRRRRGPRGAWQERTNADYSQESDQVAASHSTVAAGLVEASRRWRQLYATYRSQHREQWQQEAQEEAELVAAKSAASRQFTGAVGGVLGCVAQESSLRPCCAAMVAAAAATPQHWRRRGRDPYDPEDD